MGEPEDSKLKFKDSLLDQEWFNRTYDRFSLMEKLFYIAYNLYSDPRYEKKEAIKALLGVVDEYLIYHLDEK